MSLRINWHSNIGWTPSGYGNQTALFVPRLHALGHAITGSAQYGLKGAPVTVDGVRWLPGGNEGYGNDVLAADANYTQADIVITLIDVQIFANQVTRRFRWCPWLPIDTFPAHKGVLAALQTAWQPIVYSRFGERMLKDAGLKPLYVPHGVDTELFKPADRKEARERMPNFPQDVFLVGMVAANASPYDRKGFDEQLRAFAMLYAKHKDVMLYLHTDFDGVKNGIELRELVDHAGLPREVVAQVNQYEYKRGLVKPEYVANAYNAFDVLLSASHGEGFGIPIVEAQACGVPVIVGDWTSMSELCGAGWKVPYDEDDRIAYFNSYQVRPRPSRIYERLEEAYQLWSAGQLDPLRKVARKFALDYDADRVTAEYWKPTLDIIEARIQEESARRNIVVVAPPVPVVQPNGQQRQPEAEAAK